MTTTNSGVVRSIRCAFAFRDASSGADGSGAPSARGRLTVLALAIAAFSLLALAPLSQARVVVDAFGPPGSFGGQVVNAETGIDINQTGNGAPKGTFYIGDGNRIQRFSPSLQFESAWGPGVVASGRAENGAEFQRLTVDAASGTFTLSFGGAAPTTTSAIPFDASASSVQTALEGLGGVGSGNVMVSGASGGPWTIRFVRALGNLNQPNLGVDSSGLAGDNPGVAGAGPAATVVEVFAGGDGGGYEICTIPLDCTTGFASGTESNGFGFNGSGGLAINQATGDVYVAMIGRRSIYQFGPDGSFKRTWGWNVIRPGKPGDTGTGFEICTHPADCKGGTSGSNGGQFAEGEREVTPAIDSSGNVWIPDPNSRRIQKFDSNGNFIAAYGHDVDALGGGGGLEECTSTAAGACKAGTAGSAPGQFQEIGAFEGRSPTTIAFDSGGNLYANDHGNGRVQKFDPTMMSATDFAPATLDAFTTGAPDSILASAGGTRLIFALKNNVTAFPNERQIVEIALSDNSVKDTSLVGSGVTNAIQALAVNNATGTLYAKILASEVPYHVFAFGAPQAAPTVSMDPPAVTDTTAALSAGVNPKGGPVQCAFEYSTNLEQWTTVPDAGARGVGTLTGTKVAESVSVLSGTFKVGEKILSSDGGVFPGTTIFSTQGFGGNFLNSLTLSQAAATSGTVTLTTPGCGIFTSGGGTQPTGVNIRDLVPNERYFIRLRVSRPLVPNSSKTSNVEQFETASVPPTISDVGAIQVTDGSARLVGTIDPKNSPTGYVFEYGTTPSLGSSTAPINIGGGTTLRTVSQVVGGLSKDTEYWFRLVATNGVGTSQSPVDTFRTRVVPIPPANPGNCANEAIRVAQSSTYLPDCRAYEMVSPPNKNEGSVDQFFWHDWLAGSSTDGNAVGFCTNALFGEPPGTAFNLCAQYLSRRTDSGWHTFQPAPRECRFGIDGWLPEGNTSILLRGDFDRAVLKVPEATGCEGGLLDPAAPTESENLYRLDYDAGDPFAVELLNDPAAGPPKVPSFPAFAWGNEDLSHVVFPATSSQTPDAPAGNFIKIYDWEEPGHGACVLPQGCLTLVSKNPSNTPFSTSSALPAGRFGRALPSSVSQDGHRIYFTNGNGTSRRLYMREDGAVTYDVSASECTVSCGGNMSADDLVWASPSGDVAIFRSCDRLTDESAPSKSCSSFGAIGTGYKLYRWDRNAPPGSRLTDLTVDEEPADGVQPNVTGVFGVSDDGEVAYFATGAFPESTENGSQIVAGAPRGNRFNLYRVRWNGGSPAVDFLTPYVSTQVPFLSVESPVVGNNSMAEDQNVHGLWGGALRVTPDGAYLLINTPQKMDPAADRDSHGDAYRWSEADGWICISCQLPGAPSAGDVTMAEANLDEQIYSFEPQAQISDDGKRIFFTTRDQLVPADVNGEVACPRVKASNAEGNSYACDDLYQWHDGTVSLVSSGTGTGGVVIVGATRSSDNVFFITREQLVGWDVDTGTDIYVARVGGGFPEPPPAPAGCEGEACRGPGSTPGQSAGAGTAVFEGPGNQKATRAKPCRRGFVRRKNRCVRKKKQSAKPAKRGGSSKRKTTTRHSRRASR